MQWLKIKIKTTVKKMMKIDHFLTGKLLIFVAVMVVVPLLIVGGVSYYKSAQFLEQENRIYSWKIIEQVKIYIEDYLRDFEISTLKIANHPDVNQFLRMSSQEEIEASGVKGAVINALRNEAFSRSDITNITLVLEDVDVIDSAGIADQTVNLQEEYWYERVIGTGSPDIISRVIEWQGRSFPVISVVKRIVNPITLQPFGMVIVDVNYTRIQEIARKASPGVTGSLQIINEDGRYVYTPNLLHVGQIHESETWLQMQESLSGSFVTSNNEDLITYSKSTQLGWVLAAVIPYDEVTAGAGYIGKMILTIVVITLIIVSVIGFGLANRVVKPIKRLQKNMRAAEKGDFSRRVTIDSNDEVGRLSQGFNTMMDHISALVEEVYIAQIRESEWSLQQKETELKALQSQMNPHFLYNSLETIRGMALENDQDHIASMSASLAKLLRYNLKEPSRIVSIAQEIEMSKLYLRIQKFRYEDKLEYSFDIPDWAWMQKISRFSLQPLIENCMVHGAEPSEGRTKIEVMAEQESDTAFMLWISDTGVGISEDKMNKLRYDLDQKDISGGGTHIGMVNVHRRNQHLFGNTYGVVLKHSGKTVVGIRLPYHAEETE